MPRRRHWQGVCAAQLMLTSGFRPLAAPSLKRALRARTYLALIAIGGTLVACAAAGRQHTPDTEPRPSGLIGFSKSQLVSCAGTPAQDTVRSDREYLTYSSNEGAAGNVLSFGSGSIPTPVVAWRTRFCNVTLVMKAGVVEREIYSGFTGAPLAESRECSFVACKCLARQGVDSRNQP